MRPVPAGSGRCSSARVLVDELARDRDQLWAESVVCYRAGAAWWLDTLELTQQAEAEQSARYEGDAWDPVVLEWAQGRIASGCDSISVGEVLEVPGKEESRLDQGGRNEGWAQPSRGEVGRRQQYRQVLFGPYFKGKLEVLESLREPTGAENSPTRRPRGSSSAPTEAERGSPFAAAAGDARALTSLDSSRLESSHYPSRQWNPSKETAASLVAEGQLPIREIAQRVGIIREDY